MAFLGTDPTAAPTPPFMGAPFPPLCPVSPAPSVTHALKPPTPQGSSWRTEEGSQAWGGVGRPVFAAPWPGPTGNSEPTGGLAQPPERLPSPFLTHTAPSTCPNSSYTGARRAQRLQPIVPGKGPVARIYYRMKISQVQTTRPGCEHPLPS